MPISTMSDTCPNCKREADEEGELDWCLRCAQKKFTCTACEVLFCCDDLWPCEQEEGCDAIICEGCHKSCGDHENVLCPECYVKHHHMCPSEIRMREYMRTHPYPRSKWQ